MKYLYRINPDMQIDLVLQDFPGGIVKMCSGVDYDFDSLLGDSSMSGELNNAIRLNWVHRVPVQEEKPVTKLDVVPVPDEPVKEKMKEPVEEVEPAVEESVKYPEPKKEVLDDDNLGGKVEVSKEEVATFFDVALDMGIVKKAKSGNFLMPSISGKGKMRFKNRQKAVARLKNEPELFTHLQKLCTEE